MNTKRVVSLCVVAVCAVTSFWGCANGEIADSAPAGTHLIQLYSGGKMVRQLYSTEMPSRPSSGKGYWYFTNVETERIVRVSGSIVITGLE